ncbi:MAG: IS630 family transposase, partial [Candidatus Competibacter sp.]
LRQGHARGVIELFYFDQSSFNLTPVVPYAWQARGQTLAIPSARLNVLGFLSPTNQSHFRTVTGTVTSATVIAALNAFAAPTAQAKKLRLVVLDNAPIHISRAFQARILDWFRQGVALHWLPPYSPELNLIEILWRKIKYQWLPLRAYLSFNHLQSELQSILDQFGSKYTITFG